MRIKTKKLKLSGFNKIFILLVTPLISLWAYQHLDASVPYYNMGDAYITSWEKMLPAPSYIDTKELESIENTVRGELDLNIDCFESAWAEYDRYHPDASQDQKMSDCIPKEYIPRIHNKGWSVLKSLQEAIQRDEIISVECYESMQDVGSSFVFDKNLKEDFLSKIADARYKEVVIAYSNLDYSHYRGFRLRTQETSFIFDFSGQDFSYSYVQEGPGRHAAIRYSFEYTWDDLSFFRDLCLQEMSL